MSEIHLDVYLKPVDEEAEKRILFFWENLKKGEYAQVKEYDLDALWDLTTHVENGIFHSYFLSGYFDIEGFNKHLLKLGAEGIEISIFDNQVGEFAFYKNEDGFDHYEQCQWKWLENPLSEEPDNFAIEDMPQKSDTVTVQKEDILYRNNNEKTNKEEHSTQGESKLANMPVHVIFAVAFIFLAATRWYIYLGPGSKIVHLNFAQALGANMSYMLIWGIGYWLSLTATKKTIIPVLGGLAVLLSPAIAPLIGYILLFIMYILRKKQPKTQYCA